MMKENRKENGMQADERVSKCPCVLLCVVPKIYLYISEVTNSEIGLT